jgi:hypothetical protein
MGWVLRILEMWMGGEPKARAVLKEEEDEERRKLGPRCEDAGGGG